MTHWGNTRLTDGTTDRQKNTQTNMQTYIQIEGVCLPVPSYRLMFQSHGVTAWLLTCHVLYIRPTLTRQGPSPLTCKSLAFPPRLSHLTPPTLCHAHSPCRRSTGLGDARDGRGGPECHPDVPDLLQPPPVPHHLALLGGGAPG